LCSPIACAALCVESSVAAITSLLFQPRQWTCGHVIPRCRYGAALRRKTVGMKFFRGPRSGQKVAKRADGGVGAAAE
jgi:hypothetical protein